MKILVIYDDTVKRSDAIRDVIGEKGFGDVVVRKHHLSTYYHDAVQTVYKDMDWRVIRSPYAFRDLLDQLGEQGTYECRIIHCFSNFIITDEKLFGLSLQKLPFITKPYRAVCNHRVAILLFPDLNSYKRYLSAIDDQQESLTAAGHIDGEMPLDGVADVSGIDNFIQCITGHADARYFNSLQGDEYTITKSSTDKKKIKSEYMFYHLLPDDMKMWFVMPFNYQENQKTASYTMEKLHMTDLAIKWVHNSISKNDFAKLMDRYFMFFHCRHEKAVSAEEYKKVADALYVGKVKSRVDNLKKLPQYEKISQLLQASNGISINDVVNKYLNLKTRIESESHFDMVSVIGHGDPCFANALYNKSTQMLKFIDPKGAQTEEELWTNPYYDIAKLSHSVCGNYDFFNNGLFDVQIDEQFHSKLTVNFDNSEYVSIFRKKVEENGYYFPAVRIYEASLFISMLPLHIDNPYKVYGFILNAIKILQEVENEV